jgi:hypothetical protein
MQRALPIQISCPPLSLSLSLSLSLYLYYIPPTVHTSDLENISLPWSTLPREAVRNPSPDVGEERI